MHTLHHPRKVWSSEITRTIQLTVPTPVDLEAWLCPLLGGKADILTESNDVGFYPLLSRDFDEATTREVRPVAQLAETVVAPAEH